MSPPSLFLRITSCSMICEGALICHPERELRANRGLCCLLSTYGAGLPATNAAGVPALGSWTSRSDRWRRFVNTPQ